MNSHFLFLFLIGTLVLLGAGELDYPKEFREACSDIGFRIFNSSQADQTPKHPEPMV